MGFKQDVIRYLTRPIIPFCFGLPLLLPASLLVAVAFLQDNISAMLNVLGILLLVLSVTSIAWGMTLGFHDIFKGRNVNKRPVTRGFQKTNKPISASSAKMKNGVTKNSVSPNGFLSPPSYTTSSSSSPVSSNRSVSHVIINETVRLVPYASSKKKRRFLKKKMVRNKKGGMPSVKEEDSVHSSLEVRDESNHGSQGAENARRSARTLERLEKQLREIGLGNSVPGTLTKDFTEMEAVPPLSFSRQNTEGELRAPPSRGAPRTSSGLKRTRSMPEHATMVESLWGPQSPRGTGVPGGAREEEKLRKSTRSTNRSSEQPVLVGDSCERVGVRSDMGNIF